MATPFLAVNLHGYAFFFPLLILAIYAGFLEKSFDQALRSILKGISHNKFLFIFVICYVTGFVLNVFSRGKGFADWRLLITPGLILLALFYAFAFMNDDVCNRYFQIAYIIVAGVQSFFSMQILSGKVDIARTMWNETSGAWIYGNQFVFTTYAVILPLLLWRSFKETGVIRLILILSCVFMLITSSISSFAAPLVLIILSAPILLTLSVFLIRKNWKVVILLAGVLPIFLLLGYRYTQNNPLFQSSYLRIENFVRDPESGGYLGISNGVSRWYLAEISFKTFQTAPLTGMGGPREYNPYIGQHSSFFDSLAIYGLLGGGGALCGIVLLILLNSARQFWYKRNWETLLALTVIVLLLVIGIADPYWEPMIPLVFILSRPIYHTYYQVEKTAIQSKPNPLIKA